MTTMSPWPLALERDISLGLGDAVFVIDDEDERSLLADLQCFAGNEHGVLEGREYEPDIDKLSWPELVVLVFEGCAKFDAAGTVLDGIIEEGQDAFDSSAWHAVAECDDPTCSVPLFIFSRTLSS